MKPAVDDPYPTLRWSLRADEIESESFRTIDTECATIRQSMPLPLWRIARRLIHTTADPSIADTLHFRNNPVECGLEALSRKAPLFCDSTMIRSGISLSRLRQVNPAYEPGDLHCFIKDPDIIENSKETGHTRAICSAEKAKRIGILEGSIVLIGNAPLALARIAEYILQDGIRPSLVIGMPVGFVNVVESKQLLAKCDVPQIVIDGRRGGSPLAVATLHAIIESAH